MVRDANGEQRLGHSFRAGKLLLPGLASDYAAMIRAALALFEASGERKLLEQALAWQRALDAHYADADSGGYYLTADDAGDLLLRPHATTDDATPNPNAVAAGNLVRLAALTGDTQWRDKADRLMEGILSAAARNLFGHVALLNALDLRLRAAEIVITGGRRGDCAAQAALQAAVPRPHRAARAPPPPTCRAAHPGAGETIIGRGAEPRPSSASGERCSCRHAGEPALGYQMRGGSDAATGDMARGRLQPPHHPA